ncbi:MAG TPA: hypothetical protein GXX14_10585 [Clostridiaceae bacterium]|nr:hypothetical protein [Clostridiaceae bacterium]
MVPDTVFQLRLPSQPVTVPPHAGCILLYLTLFAGHYLILNSPKEKMCPLAT